MKEYTGSSAEESCSSSEGRGLRGDCFSDFLKTIKKIKLK